VLLSSKITQKGVTNIAELESNFKMDQVEQKLPDVYCQHQNPDGVLNIGYTSSILWLMAMVSGTVLHATSLIYYAFLLLSNGFMCGQGLTSVEKFIFPGIIKLENDERLEIFEMSK